MANNENLIPIPGRLHSVATEGHVAGADEIYDDTQQKNQATINSELIAAVGTGGSVDSKIAAAKEEIIGDAASDYNTLGKLEDKIQAEATRAEAAESALDGRVDTLEEAVGTGGSVDSRISAAVATETTRAQAAEDDRYTKSETYNKTELNNMITTPNQEYVSVIATAQTTAVTDVLPATGAADTTYRVGNWDGTQYNDSVFSEYAWNGSAYIKLSTKSQVGEVYDISVNHADTKYADLKAALGTNGANIPQSLRKGGMSVKFIQSSDNKYVQFRYMSDDAATVATFTNVANWQGVDTEPTAGSDNLVNGKGTYYAINKSNSKIGQLVNINMLNGRINTGGTIDEATSSASFTDVFNVSDYINKDIIVITDIISSSYATYAFLTDLNNWGNGLTPNYCSGTSVQIFYHNQNTITVPSDAVYLVVTGFHTYSGVLKDHNVNVLLKDGMLQELKIKEDELISKTQQLEFVKRVNECIYDSWLGVSGAISLNTSTFITPLIPLTSPSITIKNNGTPASVYLLLYSSDKTTVSDYYTIGQEQTRLITGLDLNTNKYCRMTFAQNDKECYIYDNTNNNYLWYGFYDFYKALKDEISELSSKADIPIVCLGGGSRLSWDSEAYTITFPAGSYVLYQNIRYSFSNPVTLSIPHNNGFVIFNPQNVATNNGVKNANANYVFTKGDRVLFTYSNLYRFISLPNGLYNITDEYIGDYANTTVSFSDRIKALKTASRAEGSITPLVFAWFSDVHGQAARIQEMKRLMSSYTEGFAVDDIISTGDEVAQYYTDDFTYWANVGANKYLQAVGNHECRDFQTGLDTYTAAQVYEKFFAPYISGWNVQSAGVNLCYYYKDYAAQKIRLIVLDCMHYDGNQNNWLIATLSSAKTSGLSVIIANHFRADVPDYIQNPFTSLITGDGGTLDSRVCEAVQDFIGVDHSGKFICHIAGHTHYDVVYTCHNYPEQLGIIIGCMTTSGADNEHQARVGRFRNLFNFIAFDTDSKLVKIIRPCCNMDRWNRAQNTLVVNYETRQIIYND